MLGLIDFYKCYRLCTRKVESFNRQAECPNQQKKAGCKLSAISLALRLASLDRSRTVRVSWDVQLAEHACKRVGSELGLEVISSDRTRKEPPAFPFFKSQGAARLCLYSEAMSNELQRLSACQTQLDGR